MADDLLGGEASSLAVMLECVDRELKMRRQVYPRWVAGSPPKMTRRKMEEELERMGRVRRTLVRWAALEEYLAEFGGQRGVLEVARLEGHYLRMYPDPVVPKVPA